ncbi:type II and III secretion system protein family protein [Bremerella sp. T1]|uniref:type II and III secretion system protein family protein n=1 Tax=Bremerella sp. TYQ1 TaxID=3119568 RepID=UPI001CCE34A5|nr:pilus assembly protein N-terminal domain-containing protein [Bremerella volcania]UBM36781.1 pilus assembly protein N-terminal domain-containing protein [Bremerella volcania]
MITKYRFARQLVTTAALLAIATLGGNVQAQNEAPGVNFEVASPNQRLEMIVNSSRIFTLDEKIPKAQVNNPELIRLTPLSPNKIQVSALKPGVTQVNLWAEDGSIFTVDVIVIGDGRELQMLLESEFPNASIKVRPLASSVVLSGFVDRPDAISRIVQMAEDYYPKVINNITVGGVQQVMLKVKLYEVSRTKLRTMGFDWAAFSGNDFIVQSVSGIISSAATGGGSIASNGADTVTFGIMGDNSSFFGFVEALRQNNLAKLLSEPTINAMSGRPASFLSGGEVPIQVASGLGTTSIEFKEFGTRVDVVPIVLGNGNIRLEVRPLVSEVDSSLAVDGTPGFRTRWVDTAVEMKSGQTFALAGLIQEKIETENRGLPYLADIPWAGAAFRRVQDRRNEVELLIIVTPELVGPLNPGEEPCAMPGTSTAPLNDTELYWRGYMEVPACGPGPYADGGMIGPTGPAIIEGEMIEQGTPLMEVPSPASTSAPRLEPGMQMRSVPTPSGPRTTPVSIQPNPGVRPSSGQSAAPVQPSGPMPGMIGPSGYDTLDF